MKINKLSDFERGWFIGDFDPSLNKTGDFEVGIKIYKKGDKEAAHYHKIATEYTAIASGKFLMNEQELNPGDIVTIEPNTQANFECLEDGQTVVVKIPSAKDDKYLS